MFPLGRHQQPMHHRRRKPLVQQLFLIPDPLSHVSDSFTPFEVAQVSKN